MLNKDKIDFVYLDYQASTPVCEEALQEIQPFLEVEYANPHSSQHIAGIKSFQAIEDARGEVAKFLNADPNEIIFTSGATEANNLALLGLCSANSERKRVLVSSIEHKCVLAPAEHLRTLGFEVDYIPVNSDGVINVGAYEKLLGDDVLLVSIMAINNEVGSIQPINECASLARSSGALFHTDAAQAAICMELDVHEMGIDLLSLSSHKMYGPKGIGALYISNELLSIIKPIIFGGGQENGIRAGTLPTHLCVGFGAAAKNIRINREDIVAKIRAKRDYFFEGLKAKVNNIQLIGPALAERHVGNANIAFAQIDAGTLLGMLQTEIAASTGSACTSGTIEPSHVLAAMGFESNLSDSCVRFSFGMDLEQEHLDFAIDRICRAVDLVK